MEGKKYKFQVFEMNRFCTILYLVVTATLLLFVGTRGIGYHNYFVYNEWVEMFITTVIVIIAVTTKKNL